MDFFGKILHWGFPTKHGPKWVFHNKLMHWFFVLFVWSNSSIKAENGYKDIIKTIMARRFSGKNPQIGLKLGFLSFTGNGSMICFSFFGWSCISLKLIKTIVFFSFFLLKKKFSVFGWNNLNHSWVEIMCFLLFNFLSYLSK